MDNSNISLKERITGCIMGGAIGDALGYQCEFKRNIKEREYTTFDNDLGIFSDDTQMMLFTINGLLWGKTATLVKNATLPAIDCIRYAYRDWYRTQNSPWLKDNSISWIDQIPGICQNRAPGFTCLNALSISTDEHHGTIKNPINQSKGCGCTMRVAPVGLFARDLKEVVQLGAESAALTHGHPLGIISTAFLSGLIYEISHDTARLFTEQLNLAFEFTNQFASINFHRQYQNDFTKLMRKAFDLSRNNARDIENIRELGEGWVAEEAVAIAIYCCLRYADDFSDAVVASVNHDGDSDSTGIIAGNIIGARLGIRSIPSYYIEHIELRGLIEEMADDLATALDPGFNPNSNEAWLKKYVECKPTKEYT